MNKQDLQKLHERVLQDSAQVKEHYKMYKVGKTWLFAGLFTISLGAGIVMGDHPDVHAATTETDSETSQSTATQTNLQAKKVVIGDKAQSQDSAPEMKAATDTTQTTTEPETQNTATQKTAAQNADAQSSTNVKTPATSDTQAQTATTNVKTTNLGDVTDESTIEQAKMVASKTYAQTGTPQQVTAISGVQGNSTTAADPVQAVSATVEDASKTYDNQSDTPATVNVKLSSNLTAPTGWFVTGNPDEYQVATNSGDLDLSQVNQNAGTYSISLSTDGLIRLNAVKANQDKNLVVTTADVTAGKLTIEKAPVVTGSVAIENTSKLYDNDATTDPTSFKVNVNAGLKAPTDWTVNADGSYTVTLASGDIEANIDSQEPGTYTISLSASGLQKLNASNPNYTITASEVTTGNFQIQDNTKLIIGVLRVKSSDTTSRSKTVTVGVSREEVVPSDWTVNYDNTDQDEVVYNVPLSYFDINPTNLTTIGTYPIKLTTTALNNLNTLNAADPDHQFKDYNIQLGSLIVTDGAVTAPIRNLSNFGDGSDVLNGKVFNDGDGIVITPRIFGTTDGNFTNFTDIIIIPSGMTVANMTTDANNKVIYSKATDPATLIENNAKQKLTQDGTQYTNLTVNQLNNYKGRQAFVLKIDSVTVTHDSYSNGASAVPIPIMVDPDVNNVSKAYYGNQPTENDAAILYGTDDNTYTNGSYTIPTGGDYPNVSVVANGLGLTNTETIGSGFGKYAQWGGSYTIKHVPVQDTYNLKDAAGNKVADSVTTQGMVGDSYDPLSIVPETITTTDGTKYILDTTSLPTSQTFKQATAAVTADITVATGATYTATYKKVIDTTKTTNQVKVNDQSIAWGNPAPTSYTVTLPSNLKAPAGWIKTTGNTYNVDVNSRDFAGALDTAAGTYNVTLSKRGLTSLAEANPDYLFDNLIVGTGNLTITAVPVKVTVTDTAGNTLKTVPTIQIGSDTTTNGDDVTVAGIPVSQLNHITFNFDDDATNDSHVKAITISADKTTNQALGHGTSYDGRPDEDVAYTAEQSGAATPGEAVAKLISSYNFSSIISFDGTTPQITKEFTRNLGTLKGLTSIDVVYNQKASATVTYVDDDNGGSVVPNTGTTLNGFGGDVIPYTVTIPTNYVAVNKVTKPTTITLTNDDKDNLVIHLKHLITYGTAQSTRTVNYVIQGGDNSKAPSSVTQKINWKTTTDHVTNTAYATPQTIYEAVKSPTIAGYTTPTLSIARDNPGVINPSAIKDTTETVTYTPNQSTTTITFTGLPDSKKPADKTITTTTDEPYKFTDIPTVAGYTPNTNELDGTGTPTGTTLTVTYKADNNSTNVTYVDDVTGKTVDTDSINGKTDDTGNYSVKVPANYELAKGQTNIVAYTITPDDTDNITVHLTHAIVSGTETTHRVINYVIDNPSAESVPQTPATSTQTINWNTSTDKVTNETVATAVDPVPGVDIQPIDGYTATIDGQTATQVPAFYAGAVNANDLKDTTVTVTYKPRTVTADVKVPSNKGSQTVTDVSGTVDNHVQVTVPDLPGYSKDKTTVPATVQRDGTITVDNPSTTGLVTYTPDAQQINVHFVDDKDNDLGTTQLTGVSDGDVDYTAAFEAQQNLLNQGYTLKRGNNNGLVSATKIYDHDDDVTPTYKVVLTKINNVKVTVNLVPSDGDGNPLKGTTPTTVHDYPGTSVDVPEIPGYTANTPTVTIPAGKDNTINVKYTADTQKVTVYFVDNHGTKLAATTLTGDSDSPVSYDETAILNLIPAGYALAGYTTGNFNDFLTFTGAITTFDHDDTKDQKWTVPIAEKLDYETVTTTRTIHFVDSNGKTVAPDKVQQVTYIRPIGAVSKTPLDFYSPMGMYPALTAPTVSGYKAVAGAGYTVENGVGNVSGQHPMKTETPKDESVTVHYIGTNQSANVKYVDDDNNGAAVGTPTALTGVTGGSATWNTDDKPAGYDLADGQVASGSYTFAAADNADVVIHLTHHISTETITATRTISFKGNTDVDESKLPSPIVQQVNWTISTDEVTGDVTFTPDANSNYQAVPLHSIPSGNAEITYVPEFTYVSALNPVKFTLTKDDLTKLGNPDLGEDSTFLNADEPYYYNAIGIPDTASQQYTVNFITPNGDVVGTTTVPGNPALSHHIEVTPNIPDGYVPTPGQEKVYVDIPKGADPKKPLIVHITTPAGQDADGVQVWTKEQVPNAPYANQYTVNFVTPNGDVIGHMSFVGNPGDKLNVTPSIPKGYVPTPGKNGNITITKTDMPDKPIVFNVTTPAGQDADGVQVWTKEQVPDAPYANQYTINFVTPNGDVVGKVTVPSNPGVDNTVDVTPDIPAGYVPTPGNDKVYVNIPKGSDPKTPITVNITTPAGKDTDPIQVWTKGEVPTDNVPSANEYTVNFVTPNGDVVGKTTIVGNPGDKHDLTPNLPKGYVPTPGKTGNITITAGDDSKTPIVFNVTTPAGQDTDGIQVWTKTEVPTDNVPSANQYTVSFVTPNGDVVGTTTVVGNPGNRFDISGYVPNGYVLNGTDGDVEIPNNQDPTQPITIGVTVPSKPADNGGPTDVPDGSSTDHGTGTPTDGTDMTTDGSDNNTVPGGDESGNNPITGGKTDNNVISTDNGQKTVGQPTSLGGANSGTQSGLVQQSSNAEAGQSQRVTGSKATSQKTGTLPQTNEQNTSVWALLGLGLMSMLSLLGFTKQKKREDEK